MCGGGCELRVSELTGEPTDDSSAAIWLCRCLVASVNRLSIRAVGPWTEHGFRPTFVRCDFGCEVTKLTRGKGALFLPAALDFISLAGWLIDFLHIVVARIIRDSPILLDWCPYSRQYKDPQESLLFTTIASD